VDQDDTDAVVVASTSDGGATWSTIVPPGQGHCHRSGAPGSNYFGPGDAQYNGVTYNSAYNQHLAYGVDGTLYLAVSLADSINDSSAVVVTRSTDGGRNWPAAPTLLDQGFGAPGPLQFPAPQLVDWSTVATDPTDRRVAYVAWDRYDTWPQAPNKLFVARTGDGGTNWTPKQVAQSPPGEFFEAIRPIPQPGGGLLALFTTCEQSTDVHCGDPGATYRVMKVRCPADWQEPCDQPVEIARRSSRALAHAAVAPDGTVYYGWIEEGSLEMVAIRDAEQRSFVAPLSATATLAGLIVTRDGTLAMAYYDSRDGKPGDTERTTDLWLARSGDAGATWWQTHIAGPFNVTPATGSLGESQGLAPMSPTGLMIGYTVVNADPINPPAAGRSDIYVMRRPGNS
jgi:hypothetical protein